MTSSPDPSANVDAPEPTLLSVFRTRPALMLDQIGHAGSALLLVRYGGRILDANDRAERLLGRTVAELRDLGDVAELMPMKERALRATYRRVHHVVSERDEPAQTTLLRADGHPIPVEFVAVPIDAMRATVLAIRDRSEIARRDNSLALYEALCERMPVGVTIACPVETPEGKRLRLLHANDAASAALNIELKEKIGHTLASIFPTTQFEADRQQIFNLLGTGRSEQLPDLVHGDPLNPDRITRRSVVSLPDNAVAMLVDDVTPAVREDLHRRGLMERIVQLGDSDRRSIALGIHDDPLQQIAAAALLVGQMRRRDTAPPDEWLREVDDALHRAMDSIRQRVFELSPPELVESGLRTALTTATDHLFAGTEVWVQIDCPDDSGPSRKVRDTTFRIAVEALTNTRKHAQATTVKVVVQADNETLRLDVIDDGKGFDGLHRSGHFGLGNMRDRAEAVGGTCAILTSVKGTTVTAVLPLHLTPTAPDDELVETLRELDRERAAIRQERDALRHQVVEARGEAEQMTKGLSAVLGLSEQLREHRSGESVDLVACMHLAGTVADSVAIRRWDDDAQALKVTAFWHRDAAQRDYLSQSYYVDRGPETYSGLVFRTGEPVVVRRKDQIWDEANGPLPPEGPFSIHEAVLLPIRAGTTTVGVMTAARDQNPDPLSEADTRLLLACADLVGSRAPGR